MYPDEIRQRICQHSIELMGRSYDNKKSCNVEEIKAEREFTSDSSSLGSVQMRDFLLWSQNKKGNLKHTIVDRAGSISVTNWKV